MALIRVSHVESLHDVMATKYPLSTPSITIKTARKMKRVLSTQRKGSICMRMTMGGRSRIPPKYTHENDNGWKATDGYWLDLERECKVGPTYHVNIIIEEEEESERGNTSLENIISSDHDES